MTAGRDLDALTLGTQITPELCDVGLDHAPMPCGCCWHTPGHEHCGVVGPHCPHKAVES